MDDDDDGTISQPDITIDSQQQSLLMPHNWSTESSYRTVAKYAIIYNGRKGYRCPKCTRMYSLPTTLYNHLGYCGKPRRFKCSFCTYSAKLKQHLHQHLKRRHNLVKKGRFDDTLIPSELKSHSAIMESPDVRIKSEYDDDTLEKSKYICPYCTHIACTLAEFLEHERNCIANSQKID